MNKPSISALSLVLAAGLCASATSFAMHEETHPNGTIDIKVTNLSHTPLKIGKGDCSAQSFGPDNMNFTLVEDTFSQGGVLGYNESRSYIVRYAWDGNEYHPAVPWGSVITFKKFLYKDKCGFNHYSRCNIKVTGGFGKPMYKMYGALCSHVGLKTKADSGTTSYIRANYNP